MSLSYECSEILARQRADRGRRDVGTVRDHSRGVEKGRHPGYANDIWIAASAMQHGLPILTSDRDFQNISQVIVRHFLPV